MLLRRYRGDMPLVLIGLLLVGLVSIRAIRGMKGSEQLPEEVLEEPVSDEAEVLPAYPLPEHVAFRNFIHFIDQELDSSGTVGAAYTMVHRGEIQYIGTYGERRVGSGEKVDAHTLFRLASVSKGFAGTLAALLHEQGILSLDDKVEDLYPGFRLKDSLSTSSMTLRHLMSHTTGLVPYAFDNLVEANEELPQIIDRLNEVDISAPPGELYGYQNVTFSMLDPIARRASGTPYEVLMDGLIFKPLGLDDASVGPLDEEEVLNLASPHVKTRKGYAALSPHEGYYNVLPAAGVNASISDLSQWLLALTGHRAEVFPDSVLAMICEPQVYTPLKYRYTRYWQRFSERYYSLGWRIYFYRGRKIIYHGGYIRGYRAEIGFCPEEDLGFAFLQNSPNNLASQVMPGFFDRWFDVIDGQ